MQFRDLDYRDSEKKWFVITEKEEVELLDEITGSKIEGDIYAGYVYVDHYQGLSMFLSGKVEKDGVNFKFSTPLNMLTENVFALNNNVLVSFDNFRVEKVDANMLDLEVREIIEEFVENEFYNELKKKSPYVLKFRENKEMDKYRAEQFPDSIEFLLTKENVEHELVWGRVEGYHTQDEEIRVVLLNDPFSKEFGLEKGDVCGLVQKQDLFDGFVAVTGYKKNKKFKI